MQRTLFFILITVALSLNISGSSTVSAQAKPTMSQEERINDSWILKEFDGKEASPVDFPNGMPSLQFYTSKDKVNGFGGCNRFHAKLSVKKNKVKIEEIVATKMACPGDGEEDFLERLAEVKEYRIEGAIMGLKLDGEVLMVFKRFEEKKPNH
jgi:heat shock protein HslJ